MNPSNDLSVVVPTRDRPERLRACLAALTALEIAPREVIVVDSASSDPGAVADAEAQGLTVIRCDVPGASRARNAGWRVASGQIVAFIDDDVRVARDWTAHIVAPFGHEDVVLVTGRVAAGAPIPGTERELPPVAITDDVAEGPFDLTVVGNVGASANLAVRRGSLAAVGGFDELLGAGARFRAAEDLDLFDRVLTLGRGWHAREAVGFHDPWRDRRTVMRLELAYGTGYGARLAKLVRSSRRRAAALARYEVRRLMSDVIHDVRTRYASGVISRLGWSAAVCVGVVRGLATPVRGGHLRARR